MEEFLTKFYLLKEMKDENSLSDEDEKLLFSTMFLLNNFEHPRDKFETLVKNKNIDNKFTGLLLCDFHHSECDKIIDIIKKYGGIYEVELVPIKDVKSGYDLENNTICIAFETPLIGYDFYREIVKSNTNKLP